MPFESGSGSKVALGNWKANAKVNKPVPSNLQVTGLRDWSNCVFGDPLLSAVFAKETSQYLIRGANTPFSDLDPFDGAPFIEDDEHSEPRRLLYGCYHCLCSIAKCYSRPGDTTADLELSWRKKLIDILANLSELDNHGRLTGC